MAQRIQLLGQLQVETDGELSPLLKNAKGCALLAYLLVTQQTQSREVVADLLWELATTAKPLKNLRTLLPHMRRWLPDLVVTRQHVTYMPGSDDFIDLLALRTAIAQTDITQLDTGLQLYKGPLLDAFFLPDVLVFNEWLTLERENLRQSVITAYHRLCRAYAQQEQWLKGVAAAQRWLSIDALDEEALRQLMQFLAASGQVAVALQQYKHSRQQMREVLDVEPSPLTVELAQKLTRLQAEQGASLMWDQIVGAQLVLPATDELAELGQLPRNAMLPYQRNHDFVGRRQMLLDLAKLLLPQPSSSKRPFVRTGAITGMGGVGKTQLAVEFAYRYGRYFPGGVYWLSFAEADNVAAEVANIGGERGMGLYQDGAQLTLKDQLGRVQKAWQEAIPRLLIFDNCEDEALLAKWLPTTGGCRVLLTSRRQQWAQALGVEKRPLAVLSVSSSIALLQQLSARVSEAEAVDIAAEVGHLPLALHLAGGFLRRYQSLTVAHYLHQLRQQGGLAHPSLQGRGVAYSPTGHELDVARTFAINFVQLDVANEIDAASRQLLIHAACYAPGESIPRSLLLATLVEDEADIDAMLLAEDALGRLVSLGFLEDEAGESFVLHRLLAAFAGKMIDEATRIAVANKLYQQIEPYRYRTGSLFVLPVPLSHLRYMTHALLTGQSEAAGRLANVLGQHLFFVADYDGAEDYFNKGMAIYEQIYGHDDLNAANCLNNLGMLYGGRGDYRQASLVYEEFALIRERVTGLATRHTAMAFNNLGYMLLRQGDYERGYAYLKKIEQIELADSPFTAIYKNNLGLAFMYLGEFEEANSLLRQALAIRQETLGEQHPYTAINIHNLGRLYLRQQCFAEAQTYLEQALAVQEEVLGLNHPHTARSLHRLGCLFAQLGDNDKAITYLERALTIQETVLDSNHAEKGLTLKDLGDVTQQQGNEAKATLLYEQARTLLTPALLPTHPYLQQIEAKLQQ